MSESDGGGMEKSEKDERNDMSIVFRGQHFSLHADRAIFWTEHQALLVADLHLGKANHFNKFGISMPAKAIQASNFARLELLLYEYKPQQLIFLGDLFHSELNDVWGTFLNFRQRNSAVEFILIKGNHDILPLDKYHRAEVKVVDLLDLSDIILTHEPLLEIPSNKYNLYGHIHPGVQLKGNGRQRVKLPCFYFGYRSGILPAFGAFTGLSALKVKQKDRVFVIVEKTVCEV